MIESMSQPLKQELQKIKVDESLERLSWLMDDLIKIPGFNWRFGLDALVGLIPGFGDTATSLVSFYILVSAVRYRVPKVTLLRMGLNIAIDYLVGSVPLVVDVSGSLLSVYGLFGLAVAFLTILSFLGALVGMARHRLPANRWRRALRFLTPGLGLGLVINFTLSATRVFVPRFGRWVSIVLVSAAVLFILGYLTPAPDSDEDEEGEKLLAMVGTPATEAVGAGPSTAVEPGT